MSITMTVDNTVDVAYIRLDSSEIVDSETINNELIFDYDKDERVIGVEILHFTRQRLDEILSIIPFESQSQQNELIEAWNSHPANA